MLKLFLWLRYLRKKKIVLLSIAAVALSVALMIVVDSLFTGYIEALRKSAVANIGDVSIFPSRGKVPQYEVFLDRLAQLEEVEAAAPFGFGGGLLYLETADVREVAIQGIEISTDIKFTDWKPTLLRQKNSAEPINFEVPGYAKTDGCWLGINVAAEPNEKTDDYDLEEVKKLIGKEVILTTTGIEKKRKVVKLRVADITSTQTYFGDKTLYIPLKKLNEITWGDLEPGYSWETKVKFRDSVDEASMRNIINNAWEQFVREQSGPNSSDIGSIRIRSQLEIYEWFAELQKQLAILMLIFGIICSVVVLLIFCIFYMIVETKLKDIAVIKSCGATSGSAAVIFLGFGGCVGLVGCGLGIILGYVITTNINTIEEWIRVIFGLKLWRSSSYMLNTIPNQIDWAAVWPIIIIAVAGCCLGALIPAIVAARTRPVEILRYE